MSEGRKLTAEEVKKYAKTELAYVVADELKNIMKESLENGYAGEINTYTFLPQRARKLSESVREEKETIVVGSEGQYKEGKAKYTLPGEMPKHISEVRYAEDIKKEIEAAKEKIRRDKAIKDMQEGKYEETENEENR
ncbi:MAG: hypothetical protein IKF52_06720 [Clostridia bacterium]|nr:hypothetical protein [Clostridia bacterium]